MKVFVDEKGMRLKRGLKKLSAAPKKVEDRNLAKNGMPEPLAYVYVEILVIPFIVHLWRQLYDI
jgi:hypothetical protein